MNIAMTEPKPAASPSLKDKVSLVTGSTSGIGLGIARALAGAGSDDRAERLRQAGRDRSGARGVAKDFGVAVDYSGADMSNPASIAEMIETTLRKFGRLDILVNNAGIQHVAPLQDFPPAKWDAIIAINLSSAFHTTRLALPSMLANKWGRIINIASAHGLVGSPYKSAYVAAKHGILGLTKVTALEVAEARHHLQRHLPRLCLHAAGRGADRRPGEGAWHPARAGDPRGAARAAAEQALRHGRGARRLRRVPRLRRGRLDHRHLDRRRWRLDRALEAAAPTQKKNPGETTMAIPKTPYPARSRQRDPQRQ